MSDTQKPIPSEDELRARAARIAALLEEAESEIRALARLPRPALWRSMMDGEIPWSVVGEIIGEADAAACDGGPQFNSEVSAARRDWQAAAAVTEEELLERWHEERARKEEREARRGIVQVVQ